MSIRTWQNCVKFRLHAGKERNLGIIWLEPHSFFHLCFSSQPSNQQVLMHDIIYRHIKVNKGETHECSSFLSTSKNEQNCCTVKHPSFRGPKIQKFVFWSSKATLHNSWDPILMITCSLVTMAVVTAHFWSNTTSHSPCRTAINLRQSTLVFWLTVFTYKTLHVKLGIQITQKET